MLLPLPREKHGLESPLFQNNKSHPEQAGTNLRTRGKPSRDQSVHRPKSRSCYGQSAKWKAQEHSQTLALGFWNYLLGSTGWLIVIVIFITQLQFVHVRVLTLNLTPLYFWTALTEKKQQEELSFHCTTYKASICSFIQLTFTKHLLHADSTHYVLRKHMLQMHLRLIPTAKSSSAT